MANVAYQCSHILLLRLFTLKPQNLRKCLSEKKDALFSFSTTFVPSVFVLFTGNCSKST